MSDTAVAYDKPLPRLEGLSGEFMVVQAGRVAFSALQGLRFVPSTCRARCARECNSMDWEWARSSGRGTA